MSTAPVVAATRGHRSAPGVLADVRERLLDDAVDRALDLGGKPRCARSSRQVDLVLHLEALSLRALRSTRPSRAAARPISSSAAGRSSSISAAQVRHLLGRSASIAPRRPRAGSSSDPPRRAEPSITPSARQALERLVVQLARPPPALLLGGLDRLPQAVLGHRLGRGHSGRRAGGEGRQQPLVLLGELRAADEPVEGREHPERAAAEDERDEQSRRGAHAVSRQPERTPPGHVVEAFGRARSA